MRRLPVLLTVALLAVVGCGEAAEPSGTAGRQSTDGGTEERSAGEAAVKEDGEDASTARGDEDAGAANSKGTTVTVGDSEFGEMLFDARKQAIYIFENDPKGKTVCYGDCAEAWPPVFTDGRPKAGTGVRASLLGTVKRRDGRLQVTYSGKALYFYAHEKPGEVRCHNIDLNGGLWWVVGPDGKRRA